MRELGQLRSNKVNNVAEIWQVFHKYNTFLCHYKRNFGAIIFFSIQKKYVAHVAQGCFWAISVGISE